MDEETELKLMLSDHTDHSSNRQSAIIQSESSHKRSTLDFSKLSRKLTYAESVNVLTQKLSHAREHSTYIQSQMSLIEGEDAQEIYLFYHFLLSSLSGVRRYVAERILFPEPILTEEKHEGQKMYRLVSIVLLPIYFLALTSYIFLFGVRIGSKATTLWLLGSFGSLVMEVFLLSPSKIWIKKIAVAKIANIQDIHAIIRDRSVTIMKRKEGLMRFATAQIQHLNPACRAARMYPHLPIARLLMSLSDHDLPIRFPRRISYQTIFLRIFGALSVAALFITTLLPEFLQDSVLEVLVTLLVNLLLLAGYNLAQIAVFVPIILFVIFAAILYAQHRHSSAKHEQDEEAEEKILERKVQWVKMSKKKLKSAAKSALQSILSMYRSNSTIVPLKSSPASMSPGLTTLARKERHEKQAKRQKRLLGYSDMAFETDLMSFAMLSSPSAKATNSHVGSDDVEDVYDDMVRNFDGNVDSLFDSPVAAPRDQLDDRVDGQGVQEEMCEEFTGGIGDHDCFDHTPAYGANRKWSEQKNYVYSDVDAVETEDDSGGDLTLGVLEPDIITAFAPFDSKENEFLLPTIGDEEDVELYLGEEYM